MKNYSWLNADSKKFLKRGYLEEGESPEDRIETIAKTAENYLKIKGFANKFASSPIKNPIGKKWVQDQIDLKNRGVK